MNEDFEQNHDQILEIITGYASTSYSFLKMYQWL